MVRIDIGEHHVKTKAEIRMMILQSKSSEDNCQVSEMGERWQTGSQKLSEEASSHGIMLSNTYPDCETVDFRSLTDTDEQTQILWGSKKKIVAQQKSSKALVQVSLQYEIFTEQSKSQGHTMAVFMRRGEQHLASKQGSHGAARGQRTKGSTLFPHR